MTQPQPPAAPESFAGMRVAVAGLGIEGRDAARFLQAEGAEITVADRRGAGELEAELGRIGVEAGIARIDDAALIGRVDAVIASQGVPRTAPLIAAAACAGTPVYGPMGLFLDRCRARVIGVSGSAGKSTTTALIGEIFSAAGREPTVGGNIGRGLLAELPSLPADGLAVVEISHTQLLRAARSPQVAALLNVTPNHLDQFSWDEYVELKRRLVSRQRAGDVAVLPFDEPVAAGMEAATPAGIVRCGLGQPPAGAPAAFAAGGRVKYGCGDTARDVIGADELRLPGLHNLRNALAATAVAAAEGIELETVAEVLRTYGGLAHRLELVAEIDGARYVNDSIATAPERTLAGLRATQGAVVLLLGGRGKDLPFEALRAELDSRRGEIDVVAFGEDGARFAAELGFAAEGGIDLAAAVDRAAAIARPGSTVLLSPAGTSFDAYPNFEARGGHFRALAGRIADRAEGGAAEAAR